MDARRLELNAPDVIAETIEGEVMVMNLPQGVYYSVTGAGSLAWPLLTARIPVGEAASRVAAAYGADAARVQAECAAFVDRLLAEGLVRPAATEGAGDPEAVAAAPGDYAGFGFERFDDMQAMLTIDPVHEVGDFGWPKAAPDKP
ncbi:MAG: PqqD family protein [Proteobacteria bacterium]|nr:PqqD family protein [Pseudomonadota bacterium]